MNKISSGFCEPVSSATRVNTVNKPNRKSPLVKAYYQSFNTICFHLKIVYVVQILQNSEPLLFPSQCKITTSCLVTL